MKNGILLFVLFLHLPAVAVEAPTITAGDYLFLRARVIDCGPYVRTVGYGKVNEKGEVVLFEDISLSVEGKAVHHVVTEIVNELEIRTGYRSKTIEIQRIPGSEIESIAKRLLVYTVEIRRGCLPKNRIDIRKEFQPKNRLDEFPLWKFDYQIAQDLRHNTSFKQDTSDAGAS